MTRAAYWPSPRSNAVAASSTSYVAAISEPAWSACSCVSASTSAIGWPFQWTRSSCMTGRSSPPAAFPAVMNSGVGFIRGAFRWVITSTTPGAPSAALVSIAARRPLGIVLKTRAA